MKQMTLMALGEKGLQARASLLVTKGIATRSKDATSSSGHTLLGTRSLLGTRARPKFAEAHKFPVDRPT